MAIDYSPESLIKNTAREIGFSDVGITDLAPTHESNQAFDRWIARGWHGEMRYLSGGASKRHTPEVLLDGAKSVISVGVNYYSESRVRNNQQAGGGVFSVYAQGRDYHHVLREMLEELTRRLLDFFPELESAICVDTEPISERDLALKSGIAWLGKNTCAISPKHGSWIFLGELITNLPLSADQPLESLCGSCTLCIDACPTGALDEEYTLDATKCISYLTIEKRGPIPDKYHSAMGNRIFGCDDCQVVCPYNAVAHDTQVFAGQQNRLLDMELEVLAAISDEEFRRNTRDSAIERCKASGLRRNADIVLRNLSNEQKEDDRLEPS